MITTHNIPVVLGSDRYAAVCLPGDVVYGCSGGVLSIPPHLLEEVIKTGRKSKVKDICGFKLLSENKFTAAAIDRLVWTKKMLDLLVDFIKTIRKARNFKIWIGARSMKWPSKMRALASQHYKNVDSNDVEW